MKSLIDILKESGEQTAYKAIFSQDGKKIDGERHGKWLLGFAEDGKVTNVNWKTFRDSKLPWSDNQKADACYPKKQFLQALINQEKQFGRKVDFNTWMNRDGKKADWETKVDKVLSSTSAKYSKNGIKA